VRPWSSVVLVAVLRAGVLAALLGCRSGAPGAPGAAPGLHLVTSPPSGAIVAVAITEAADAAITVDAGGGWRLWPALDGTRPPVVLHGSAPRRFVLGRDGDGRAARGLVAGVLDEAGAIELVRATRDGVVTGRARLPADPGFDDLVAFHGGILALGRDQVVTWFDAGGAARARLAPLPGEHLVELTARRGRALAGIGGSDRAARAVRLLALERGALRWGAYTHLTDPLRGLALSPDHRRIAGIRAGAGAGVGQVIELGGPKILEDDLRAGAHDEPAAVGFPTSGPAAIAGRGAVRRAPGDVAELALAATSLAAFGDGLVVMGRGADLALVGRARTRYLGYREVGTGSLAPAGAHFAMEIGDQLLWLDRGLGAVRATDGSDGYLRLALDERLFVEVRRGGRVEATEGELAGLDLDLDLAAVEVTIGDAAAGTLNVIGAWPRVDDVKLDPRSRVLAISAEGQAHRFAIDARGNASRLPPLSLGDEQSAVFPVDPRTADGVVAVAIRARLRDDDRTELTRTELTIEAHRGRGTPRRAVATGRVLGVDDTGAVWIADGSTVVALRDGAEVHRAALEGTAPIEDGAPSRDGAFAVLRAAHEVIALDARGAVRWRRELLQTRDVAVSDDGTTVAVALASGVVALDAATGARRAWACGWHFGLYGRPAAESHAECRPD